MNKILARLPERQSVVSVYGVAVFIVYSWTVLTSFWKIPSWLFFLKISEVLAMYAYSFVVNFVESILLLTLVLLVGVILPARWWRNRFIANSMIWILVLMGSLMLRLYLYRAPSDWETFLYGQWEWLGYTALLALLLNLFVSRLAWLQKGLETLAERLSIFLYIYLPLTAISFVVVVARNLFWGMR